MHDCCNITLNYLLCCLWMMNSVQLSIYVYFMLIFCAIILHILPATSLDPPTSLMLENVTATSIDVMWSGAFPPVNGYYISWRRTDLGDSATAEHAQVTGATMYNLTNLFAGVTYDITVWSTDGTRVSSPVSRQVTTMESGELSPYVHSRATYTLNNFCGPFKREFYGLVAPLWRFTCTSIYVHHDVIHKLISSRT